MVSHPGTVSAGSGEKISIKLSTMGYGGRTVTKVVSVKTNDPKNPAIDFTISVKVERAAEISPRILKLSGRVGETLKGSVIIIPNAKHPFEIKKCDVRGKNRLQCTFKEGVVNGIKRYTVEIQSRYAKKGVHWDGVVLTTDSDTMPTLDFSVNANIQ